MTQEVLTTISNVAEWSYAETVRYIICTHNLNNLALLDLYKVLPVSIKLALEEHGVTARTILRTDIQDITPTGFNERYGKNTVIEIAA